jgi:hypothetical protein
VSRVLVPLRKRCGAFAAVTCTTCQTLNGAGERVCPVWGTDLTGEVKVLKEKMKQWILENPEIFIAAVQEIVNETVQQTGDCKDLKIRI